MVAKRPLAAHLIRTDIALENDLRCGWHLDVDRLALDHLNGFMAQEAAKTISSMSRGSGAVAAYVTTGSVPMATAARCARRPVLHVTEILCAVLVDVPVHARRLAVILLQPVHADIALARLRILREDERQRDERAAIIRPALEDGDIVKARVLCLDDFLARRVLDVFRELMARLIIGIIVTTLILFCSETYGSFIISRSSSATSSSFSTPRAIAMRS